jgi:hypothetical protein
VEQYYRTHGRMPRSNAEASLPAPTSLAGRYVGRVELQAGGTFVATFKQSSVAAPLAGRSVRFVPEVHGELIDWRCASDSISEKFCPSACECQ